MLWICLCSAQPVVNGTSLCFTIWTFFSSALSPFRLHLHITAAILPRRTARSFCSALASTPRPTSLSLPVRVALPCALLIHFGSLPVASCLFLCSSCCWLFLPVFVTRLGIVLECSLQNSIASTLLSPWLVCRARVSRMLQVCLCANTDLMCRFSLVTAAGLHVLIIQLAQWAFKTCPAFLFSVLLPILPTL